MNIIYAEYNIHHNSIDIATTTGDLFRMFLKCPAINDPLEYARPYLEGNMQMWIDAADSLELW